MAEEDIYLSAAGEKLERGALERGRPVPAAIGPTPPHGKRTAVGETAQAAEPEACSGGQVMEAEAQRHRPGNGCVLAGAGERLSVVVVSVHEQKLEPRTTEQSTGGAKEAAPFRVARQIAEVAEGDERVAALLNGALDQVAQVASVAMHVAENEQTAHSARLPRLCSFAERAATSVYAQPGLRLDVLEGWSDICHLCSASPPLTDLSRLRLRAPRPPCSIRAELK